MEKPYVPPTVQMMSFRYRDQVVAASGVAPQIEGGNDIAGGDNYEKWQWVYDAINKIWKWIFG